MGRKGRVFSFYNFLPMIIGTNPLISPDYVIKWRKSLQIQGMLAKISCKQASRDTRDVVAIEICRDMRVKWDLWYIDNWSFWLDLHILLWTIPAVLKGKRAY